MKICIQYHNLLKKILDEGVRRNDPNREGVTRLQIPFHNMLIDLREGFPILTTKKMWWKGIVGETLWLLKGNSNIKELIDQGINIWNKDAWNYYIKNGGAFNIEGFLKLIKEDFNGVPAYENNLYCYGDIGRMYGVQWRDWDGYNRSLEGLLGVDQLVNVIQQIKDNPLSSNHVIFGDNPADRDEQALPCCMNYMQFSCEPTNLPDFDNNTTYSTYYLDLSINYRSWDVLLGAPFNIAQYALILEIIAKITGTVPRYLNINATNVHLYGDQILAAIEQFKRNPIEYDLPKLTLPALDLTMSNDQYFNRDWSDFKLERYKSYPKLENQPEMISYDTNNK